EQSGVTDLSLVVAGRGQGNAAELLASARLRVVLEQARETYDVVVIDGPPVIGLADAPLLGSLADATVVVIESGGARIGAVNETLTRLRSSNARVAGAILAKFPEKLSDGDYYYYYDYNYGEDGVSNPAGRKISLEGAGD
ncbi:MAG: capsular biosynthesis protein, partial [Pseudomonadota bacterium]